uniref:Uncharacterized protein n=1 Tax=Kalanchoe fedtschenkoi TaxID=63787 RepID=A0A7N1A9Y8_KALFE
SMSPPPNTTSTECGNCSFNDRWLLHYVRLRGEHRRLCTSCVLKLHPASFCPICLREPCLITSGWFARSVRRSVTRAASPIRIMWSYTCPTCIESSFGLFNVTRNSDQRLEIDLKSAKVLLCAAQIAAESMTRAMHMSEADAARRVQEGAVSRKRAKEALEDSCAVVAREKCRKLREDTSAGGSHDRNGGAESRSRDRMVLGISAPRSWSSVGLENRLNNRDLVLGAAGNSNVVRVDDKRDKSSNGDVRRSIFS